MHNCYIGQAVCVDILEECYSLLSQLSETDTQVDSTEVEQNRPEGQSVQN